MFKIFIFLTLIFASRGFISAQEALPSSESSQTSSSTKIELPTSPLDPLISEWLTEGKLKDKAQELMNNIQNRAAKSFENTTGQVQNTAKDEINRQVDKQINDAKQGVQGYVQVVVGEIKNIVGSLIESIKTFFRNLFNKTPTV